MAGVLALIFALEEGSLKFFHRFWKFMRFSLHSWHFLPRIQYLPWSTPTEINLRCYFRLLGSRRAMIPSLFRTELWFKHWPWINQLYLVAVFLRTIKNWNRSAACCTTTWPLCWWQTSFWGLRSASSRYGNSWNPEDPNLWSHQACSLALAPFDFGWIPCFALGILVCKGLVHQTSLIRWSCCFIWGLAGD